MELLVAAAARRARERECECDEMAETRSARALQSRSLRFDRWLLLRRDKYDEKGSSNDALPSSAPTLGFAVVAVGGDTSGGAGNKADKTLAYDVGSSESPLIAPNRFETNPPAAVVSAP